MANFIRTTFIFIVLLFNFCVFNGYAEVITLRADEWCPYNCQPNANQRGFMIELAEIVFKKAGHTIDYQIMPWARAIQDTRKGKVNAIVGAGKEDAPDFIFPENEQGQMISAFYVKKEESWRYNNMESLKDKILGVINDYSYNTEIDKYIKENKKNDKLIQVASGNDALTTNVKKLLAGRIHVLVEDRNVMAQYIKTNSQDNAIQEAGTSGSDTLYFAFSPANTNSAAYAKLLSDGVVELRKSGELKIILEKYGLKDWK
ncbi:MAG: transporter substrate-binding domain-containing protein [Desulfobacterales bacterium]|nr:transporter substrate-binding domain-containing protein [Desulfobacterales bacterium]